MKRGSILFLKAAIVLIGVGVLAFLIRFPMTEGRAVNLDLVSIYSDPFILYGYLVSIAFFVALYQVFKLLEYIGHDTVFSLRSVKALRTIKYCAIILSVSIIVAAVYIRISFNGSGDDDPAGFVAMSIVTTFISIVVATTAGVFEGIVQKAVTTKSGSDLTV